MILAELMEALIEAVGLYLDDGSTAVRDDDGAEARVRARVEEMTLVTVQMLSRQVCRPSRMQAECVSLVAKGLASGSGSSW